MHCKVGRTFFISMIVYFRCRWAMLEKGVQYCNIYVSITPGGSKKFQNKLDVKHARKFYIIYGSEYKYRYQNKLGKDFQLSDTLATVDGNCKWLQT